MKRLIIFVIVAAVASTVALTALTRRPPTPGAGPTCIGLIVLGCSTQPAVTPPVALILSIILGALAIQWLSLHVAHADDGAAPSDRTKLADL